MATIVEILLGAYIYNCSERGYQPHRKTARQKETKIEELAVEGDL